MSSLRDPKDGVAESQNKPPEYSPRELRKIILRQGQIAEGLMKPDARYGAFVVARVFLPFFAAFAFAPSLFDRFGPSAILFVYFIVGIYGYKMSFVMHDASHDSLFASRALNRFFGRMAGLLVGVPFDTYKATHMSHHRANGRRDDIDLGEYIGFERMSRWERFWHLASPLIGGRLINFLRNHISAKDRAGTGSQRRDYRFLANVALLQAALAIVATDFGRLPLLALTYPAAAMTVSLFLGRLRTVAEHAGSAGYDDFARSHAPRFFDRAVLYDANFNYHYEHHVLPQVPSCHLSTLRREYCGTKDKVHFRPHGMLTTLATLVRDGRA